MYKIGDKVSNPMHGAGTITAIEQKTILNEAKDYYIIKVPVGDMIISVPVDSAEKLGLRPIIDRKDLDDILNTLKAEGEDINKNWNHRHRDNFEKMKTGEITDLAEVVRDLKILSKERTLSGGDRKMLNGAMDLLVSEMMLAYDVDQEMATNKINKYIFMEEE